ncbi:MAG: DsbA family protein [Parvibaculum sp.]
MKIFLMRLVTTFLTSRTRRNLRRAIHAFRRKLKGAKPTVYYFHQTDDPYSHLAAQLLTKLKSRYRVELAPYLVSAPDDAAAPEREKLRHYALRDAARVARRYSLAHVTDARLPDPSRVEQAAAALAATIKNETFTEVAPQISTALWAGDAAAIAAFKANKKGLSKVIAAGNKRRKAFGHYLSAMFYFEGEWYWGVDRLHHLEARLNETGLDTAPKGMPMIAPFQDISLATKPTSKSKPVIDYWFSFRSPYSCISARRMWRLAHHYDCELRLRFILPMVMRGLPVPLVKRMYITLDTKREAECVNESYGTIVDPVGAGAARALAVLHHAIPLEHGEAFAELGMRAAFADGIELASDKGMFDVARRAGLTDEQTRGALADESWREVAEENREALFDAGLWGAPSFRVDGRPAHWGQDRFWALEEDILDAIAERNT